MSLLPKLYLASASPRRKQILESLGLTFEVIQPRTNEIDPPSSSVDEGVIHNARVKADAGLKMMTSQPAIIIAADTLVVLENNVLGKPSDSAEAITMLSQLSGKKHRVVTGLVLRDSSGHERVSAVSSYVKFRKLSLTEIKEYTLTKEPYDKAGSYAIQGLGAVFIDEIQGSYTNIMGFPVEHFLKELPLLTQIPAYQWFLP
ncbi:MAG: septum formation protein Maf [Proteobacteria bacterium]|nr:septum formation protein Maf [Pseudomonadota bacterium]NDC23815.1 septum formation protein Maf [Pseudomonadota bacterium]NDD03980.1 septum formation protein Maf [Pseudomonadota bacterium]